MEKKIEDVGREMAWFVGRALSYIDVTVDAPREPGDKYPKKEVLKKLFEKEIYEVRNKMYEMEESKIIKNMSTMFESLVNKLTVLASASISDASCRNNFITLLNDSSEEVQNKLKVLLGN